MRSTTSPFAKPAARRAERLCSYVVWLFSAVLFVDRAVMGFVSVVQGAVASNSNPKDFLSAMVYMVYKGRGIFARGSVRAAQWIVGKKPGVYDMQDVLGVK